MGVDVRELRKRVSKISQGTPKRLHVQRECLRTLRKQPCNMMHLETLIRKKLPRWQREKRVEGVPGRLSGRLERNFTKLGLNVPPAVISAVVRTFWNGWCTDRRFQRIGTCKLGLPCQGDDSIEHYASCVHVKDFALLKMRLPPHVTGLSYFLLLENVDEPTLVRIALLVYAVYTTTQQIRKAEHLTPASVRALLWERVHSVCTNHGKCAQVMSSIWQ